MREEKKKLEGKFEKENFHGFISFRSNAMLNLANEEKEYD